MPTSEARVRVDKNGAIVYISIVHPIGDEFYLIEQIVDKDGNVSYYTNDEEEPIKGIMKNSWIEKEPDNKRT